MGIDERSFERVLAASYDLALHPDGWPALLQHLGQSLRCHFSAAIATTPDRSDPKSLGVCGISSTEHVAFLHRWHRQNPVATRYPVRAAGQILVTGRLIPRPELERTALYREWLDPHDIQQTVRFDVLCEKQERQAISLGRPWRAGPFTTRELRFAAAVMPHLQRAASLAARARGLEHRARIAEAALGTRGCVLLLDGSGGVLHATAAAERLVAAGDGLALVRRPFAPRATLQAATPSCTARLLALIARAAGPRLSGALRLPRSSGAHDLLLVALPLPPGAVMLEIREPAVAAAPPLPWLREAFGLTEAEGRLALALLAGESPAHIAARTGRSIATVRTHLASLLRKTGTARQGELIGLLARLPVAPRER